MSANPLEFDPDLYDSPDIYYTTLERPFVIALGSSMDRETLKIVEERARSLGREMGSLALARKELDADGNPIIDWFPIYIEKTTSEVGNYKFESTTEVRAEHVESVEAYIFTRPEFFHISEEDRRRNVIRLSMCIANNEEGLESMGVSEYVTVGHLLGPGMIRIVSTREDDGSFRHEYKLGLEKEDNGNN